MNKPLVSLICGGLNVEKFVNRCFTSVLQQTYENVEFIFINDGSTDNTAEIVKSFTNVELINFETNKGKGAGLKEVFNKYDYDIICLLDADIGITSIEAEKLINPVLDNKVDFTVARFPVREKAGKRRAQTLKQTVCRFFYRRQ